METQPHVYVIAGEPSGDRLGARLIAALNGEPRIGQLVSDVRAFGYGAR